MTYLLDINVLIALFDAAHIHHDAAHRWFGSVAQASWATCPITENGFVRVISNPGYRSVSTTSGEATERLHNFCAQQGHVFWADAVSLTDSGRFDVSKLLGHQQISDLYLIGLAQHYGGKLATFDTKIPIAALISADPALVAVIPTA